MKTIFNIMGKFSAYIFVYLILPLAFIYAFIYAVLRPSLMWYSLMSLIRALRNYLFGSLMYIDIAIIHIDIDFIEDINSMQKRNNLADKFFLPVFKLIHKALSELSAVIYSIISHKRGE